MTVEEFVKQTIKTPDTPDTLDYSRSISLEDRIENQLKWLKEEFPSVCWWAVEDSQLRQWVRERVLELTIHPIDCEAD